MDKTYRLAPARVQHPFTGQTLALSVGVLAIVFVASGYVLARNGIPESAKTVLAALVVPAVLLTVAVLRTLKRTRKQLASFELDMSDDGLSRKMAGCADIEIRRAAVTGIEDTRYGLVVRAGRQHVVVPRTLDQFDEVRERLRDWAMIQEQRRRLPPLVTTFLLTALVLGMFVVVFTSANPVVVVPFALLFAIGLVGAAWVVRRDNLARLSLREQWPGPLSPHPPSRPSFFSPQASSLVGLH